MDLKYVYFMYKIEKIKKKNVYILVIKLNIICFFNLNIGVVWIFFWCFCDIRNWIKFGFYIIYKNKVFVIKLFRVIDVVNKIIYFFDWCIGIL